MGNMVKASYKEIDIEDFIWEGIPSGLPRRRGLKMDCTVMYRQFEIPGCGKVDLMGIKISHGSYKGSKHKRVTVTVYELKRGTITCDAVGQLSRYIKCIEQNWRAISDSIGIPSSYDLLVSGVLVGHDLSRDARCLCDLSHYIEAYTFDVCWDKGLFFKEEDYSDFNMEIDIKAVAKHFTSKDFIRFAKASVREKVEREKCPPPF